MTPALVMFAVVVALAVGGLCVVAVLCLLRAGKTHLTKEKARA